MSITIENVLVEWIRIPENLYFTIVNTYCHDLLEISKKEVETYYLGLPHVTTIWKFKGSSTPLLQFMKTPKYNREREDWLNDLDKCDVQYSIASIHFQEVFQEETTK